MPTLMFLSKVPVSRIVSDPSGAFSLFAATPDNVSGCSEYSSVQAVKTENRKHLVLECKALIPHNQMSLISPGLCGFWGNMYRWI